MSSYPQHDLYLIVFISQWQQASCPILYFVIEYKLANQLDWTIGDLSKQSLQLNHQLHSDHHNGSLRSDEQPASTRRLQHPWPPAGHLLRSQGKKKTEKYWHHGDHDHRYIILIVPTNQVTAHNHAGSRSAAYQFSTLTPLGSPARSQFTIHMSLSSLSPRVLTLPCPLVPKSACPHAAIS